MSKAVKCLLVDVDNVLISEVVEVDAELGDPNCRLVNPYRFLGEGKFEPWPKATNQRELMIRSEDILTIADPTPEVVEEYLKLTECDFTRTSKWSRLTSWSEVMKMVAIS